MLAWQLHPFSSTETLVSEAADRWLNQLESLRRPGRPLTVALAGGRVAKSFLESVSRAASVRQFDFSGVHFFWGDERCVPPEDSESNFALADAALFRPCGIPPTQIHRVKGEWTQAEAVTEAERVVRLHAALNAQGFPILDLVVLGMGEDGHVASLFPDTPDAQAFSAMAYIPVLGPKPPPQRVSLTFGTLAAARHAWVIASGAGKAEALNLALNEKSANPLGRLLRMRPATEIFTDIVTP
ncbi:MAG TPA: 6-phosphogluconolactonase [Candidatus Limnocylindria bacterium]|jgi:6-phosphogluconolactonase|nr:6-phosphogluconolactonase [Candidatus Limnocylindria bacterium]